LRHIEQWQFSAGPITPSISDRIIAQRQLPLIIWATLPTVIDTMRFYRNGIALRDICGTIAQLRVAPRW
jgi:hypothetical protein